MNQSSLITNHSLSIAMFLAMLIHAVVMFSIHMPKIEPQRFSKDIDVILVNSITANIQKPDQPHILSQNNQIGAATETHQALAAIEPQNTLQAIKPTPQINRAVKTQDVKPIEQTKHTIKTPPPVNTKAPETKRVIEPPKTVPPKPAPIKPFKPVIKPVEKIQPVLAKPSNQGLPKLKDVVKETEVATKPIETIAKAKASPIQENKKTMPVQEHNKKAVMNPFSATGLQQQIAEYGSEIQQDAIKTQTKVKSVNQITAHKYVAAQYLRDWESKVERTGNMNYPAAATKPGFSAMLMMEVYINSDGSIESMQITRSSGNAKLDKAAKKIVEMSAPFPPLPEALREEVEVLKITRVWKFSDESGLISK